MDELKPCPFCGHKAEIRCNSTGTSSQTHHFFKEFVIWCPNCGCTQNHRAVVTVDYFPTLGMVSDDSELIKRKDEWNRRVNDG